MSALRLRFLSRHSNISPTFPNFYLTSSERIDYHICGNLSFSYFRGQFIMKCFQTVFAASALVFVMSSAHAAIQVGAQAKLTPYQSIDGKTIDVEAMKGKILVVDFLGHVVRAVHGRGGAYGGAEQKVRRQGPANAWH